jgi:hypothetical protein
MMRETASDRALALVVVFMILAGVLPDRIHAEGPQSKPAIDAFEQVDLEFRLMYSGGRAATLARLGPVIVVELDQLVLIRDGKRTEVNAIPALYHRLKSVSHAPLAIYVALAPYGGAPLDEPRMARLRSFRGRIAAVETSLDGAGFDKDQLERSRSLLQRCGTFLDRVLERGTYDAGELKALTRAAGPIVLANARDAAKAQIDAYHAQVGLWRREIPVEEWAKLHVLILGPQMPRKHNLAVQYFAKLMDIAGESRRLVYAEELSGEQQGLNLVATHQIDGELSEAFFGDRERMEIDLLGNAASVYLDGFDFTK